MSTHSENTSPTPGASDPTTPRFSSLRIDSIHMDDSVSMNRMHPAVQKLKSFVDPVTTNHEDLHIKEVFAEFLGTFLLIFFAVAGPILNDKYLGVESLVGMALIGGAAVMAIISAIGHISGSHLNPAVTVAFATFKFFPWKRVPYYVLAQLAGGICAGFMLKGVFYPFANGGVTVPSVPLWQAVLVELMIGFDLMFVVTAVTTDSHAVKEMAGVSVGAVIALNILIAGPSTGASMNPARTLGPAIAANNYEGIWVYMVCPFVGMILGAGAYALVRHDDHSIHPPTHIRSFHGGRQRKLISM